MLGVLRASALVFTILLISTVVFPDVSCGDEKYENYPVAVSATTECMPDMTTLANGSIHVAFLEDNAGVRSIVYKYSTDGGRSFYARNVATLSTGAAVTKPAIAVDYQLNVYVGYYDSTNAVRRIHIAKLARGGNGFVDLDISAQVMGNDGCSEMDIDMIATYNFVGIVYKAMSGANYYFRMVFSNDNGAIWKNMGFFDPIANLIAQPAASIHLTDANHGEITLAYYEETTTGYLRFKAYQADLDGSGISSLLHDQDIDSGVIANGENVHDPAIVTLAGNTGYKAYLAWTKIIQSYYYIYFRTIENGYASMAYKIRGPSNELKRPSIAVTPTGIVHAAWIDYVSATVGFDVMYSYSTDGMTFSTPVRVNKDLGSYEQDNVKIALNGTQGPFIVWDDHRTGNWDVYFEDLRAGQGYHLDTVFNIGTTEIPQYLVKASLNVTDESNNIYIILGGVGKCTVIKYPQVGETVVNTIDIGADGVINAITVKPKSTYVIAVGSVGTSAGVWMINPTAVPPTVSLQTGGWFSAANKEYYDIEWGYDAPSSSPEAYYFVASLEASGDSVYRINGIDNSMVDSSYLADAKNIELTHDGLDYIMFRYSTSYSMLYNPGGSAGDMWNSITVSGLPSGTINDAYALPAGAGSLDRTTIYLACNSTGGGHSIYRVRRDTTYSATSDVVPVEGDFDSDYFNMYSIDIEPTSGWAILVGENTFTTPPKGVFVSISNVLQNVLNDLKTDAFFTTEKRTFTSVEVLDPSRSDGSCAIITGQTSSPGVYYINFDAYDEANLNINAENVQPYVEVNAGVGRVYITKPGETIPATNRIGEELMATGTDKYEFWVYIIDSNGISDIDNVKFRAFYDNGAAGESGWPASTDRNAKVEITYTRSTDSFALTYPTSAIAVTEVAFNDADCSATADPDGDEGTLSQVVTLCLKFVFAPCQQSRAASGGSTGGYDSGTWNFEFQCTDSSLVPVTCTASNNGKGEASMPAWEFGYQKRTGLVGVDVRTATGTGAGGSITPGTEGITPLFQLAWSSNGPYRISIEMKGMLTHQTAIPPGNTIAYTNTYVYQGSEYTDYGGAYADAYLPNTFGGGRRAFTNAFAKVYWYGDSTPTFENSPPVGAEQTFKTQFAVFVPIGTKAGQFSATMQYVVDIQ